MTWEERWAKVRRRQEFRQHTADRWARPEGMSGRQWKRYRRALNRAAMTGHRP